MTEPIPAEVAAFIAEARKFCSWVEPSAHLPLRERLLGTRNQLAALYAAACLLPDVEYPAEYEQPERSAPRPTFLGYGEREHYWEVFDPYRLEDAVCGSLSDDVLDVHHDLIQPLLALDAGAPWKASVWEWRWAFHAHWGDHAIDGLRALQRICAQLQPE